MSLYPSWFYRVASMFTTIVIGLFTFDCMHARTRDYPLVTPITFTH